MPYARMRGMRVGVDESGHNRLFTYIDLARASLRRAANIFIRAHRQESSTGNGHGLRARFGGIDGQYVGVVEDQIGFRARGAPQRQRTHASEKRAARWTYLHSRTPYLIFSLSEIASLC